MMIARNCNKGSLRLTLCETDRRGRHTIDETQITIDATDENIDPSAHDTGNP